MIMRSLQPQFARHLMGFPHTNFGSLVQALYVVDDGAVEAVTKNIKRILRRMVETSRDWSKKLSFAL